MLRLTAIWNLMREWQVSDFTLGESCCSPFSWWREMIHADDIYQGWSKWCFICLFASLLSLKKVLTIIVYFDVFVLVCVAFPNHVIRWSALSSRISDLFNVPLCSFSTFTDCARQVVRPPWLEAFKELARQNHDLIWHWQGFCPCWEVRLEGHYGYLLTNFSVMMWITFFLCGLTVEVAYCLFPSKACRFSLQYLFWQ